MVAGPKYLKNVKFKFENKITDEYSGRGSSLGGDAANVSE